MDSSTNSEKKNSPTKIEKVVSIPKEYHSLRNAIVTNSEPTILYVTKGNIRSVYTVVSPSSISSDLITDRYRVSFRPKKRFQEEEGLENISKEDKVHSPKRKRLPQSEEIIPLEEFFKPEELKWNQEKVLQVPDLKLKEDQIEQFSQLFLDCDQFLSSSGSGH
jgi:hypothetical protein